MNTVKTTIWTWVSAMLIACSAQAQTSAPATASGVRPLELQARTVAGERFSPESLKGRVSIVFFWSTACAVCRDSLPELRANLMGWRDKPFSLVTVNVDRNAEDWKAYERILGKTTMPPKNLFAVRQEPGANLPPKLPLTLLVNAKGNVVARYEGRLAPEAWDGVADLLP